MKSRHTTTARWPDGFSISQFMVESVFNSQIIIRKICLLKENELMHVLKPLSPLGLRVHLWAVPIREATWCQPHWLHSHSDHQTGVALTLGHRPRLYRHAGYHRHLFRHRHFCPVQWHAHCPSFGARDELRVAYWNLPVLCHHIPDDRDAGCGRVLPEEDFLRLGDVF